MSDVWEEDTCSTAVTDAVPREEIEEVTWQYLPAHRKTTETCPMCQMKNALSVTEVRLGYLCDDCAGR